MTARAIVLPDRGDGADLKRWVTAAAIVLAVHFGLMATYLLLFPHTPTGAPRNACGHHRPGAAAGCAGFADGCGARPGDGGGPAATRAGSGPAKARADHRAAATGRGAFGRIAGTSEGTASATAGEGRAQAETSRGKARRTPPACAAHHRCAALGARHRRNAVRAEPRRGQRIRGDGVMARSGGCAVAARQALSERSRIPGESRAWSRSASR